MTKRNFLIEDNFNDGKVLVYDTIKAGRHTHQGEQIKIVCVFNIKPQTITYQQLYLTLCIGSINKANKIIGI